jgi:hypothetical protein
MKQKGSALIIILILILLTVIGFFVYRDYLSPKGTILGPFVPSPTATADPAADWKTYTNNYWEISLKYPQDKLTPCPSYTTESEGIRFFSFGFSCPNGTDVTYKVGVVGYKPGQYKEVKAPNSRWLLAAKLPPEKCIFTMNPMVLCSVKRNLKKLYLIWIRVLLFYNNGAIT